MSFMFRDRKDTEFDYSNTPSTLNTRCDSCNKDLRGSRIHSCDIYLLRSGGFQHVDLCPDCEAKLDNDSLDVLANWLYIRDCLDVRFDAG